MFLTTPSLREKSLRVCVSIAFAALFSVFSFASYAQTILTDHMDYAPGETVSLSGSGFGAGETVTVIVLMNTNGDNDNLTSPAHQPFTTTADADGNFATTWVVPADGDEAGALLIAKATGQTSGAYAEFVFSDSEPNTCPLVIHNSYTDFNASSNAGTATTLWFNLHTKLTATQLVANGDYILFTGGTLTFTSIGASFGTTASLPDGKIIADNTVSVPTTSFDAIANTWITKVPLGYASSDIFIAGAALTSTNGFTVASGKKTTLSGYFYSNVALFSSSWFYGEAAYQPTFTNATVGVVNSVNNTPGTGKAGSPVDQTDNLVAGGSGGGGSNLTGSYSSTDNFTACAGCVAPTVNIEANGPTTFCSGGSVTLSATGASTYLWSTGATTASITVSGNGTYSVSGTSSLGCSSAPASTVVTVNQPPVVSIIPSGPTTVCGSGSVLLSATGAVNYVWSTTATTSSISVSTAGTYSVTGTDANGCSDASGTVAFIVNPTPTVSVTPSGDTTFCQGGSVTLSVSGADTYAWSTGATTTSIVVSTAGIYSVTGTSSDGCASAPASIHVTTNPLPVCGIDGIQTVCAGGSRTFTATAGMSSYLWSTGATTSSIGVSTTGTYSVTITNANGCTSTCSRDFTVNPLPTCGITGEQTVCAGGSRTFVATAGMSSYLWSTGATTSSISVNTTGTYSVTITNQNGCTSSCSRDFTVNPLPVCSIDGIQTVCAGGSRTFTASAGMSSYLWSTGATTSSIEVSTTGTYNVTITNANGCTSTCSRDFTVNPLPTCGITGIQTVCAGGSRTFTATAGMSSYLWSTGATTSSIEVSVTGAYSVTITNANGCTSTCSRDFTVNPLPICGITGEDQICSGATTQYCATAGMASYLWSTGATTACISVNTTGTYNVTITNQNGCSSTCGKTLTVNPLPVCTVTGDTTVCAGGSVQFCAATATTYLWSTGATTQCIAVATTGTYGVTTTNASGCTSICSRHLTVNPLPTCGITGIQTVCAGGSRTFSATAGMASYLWSTGATTSSIEVSTTGTYSVTITNANGCTSSCSRDFTVNPLPVCGITGEQTVCAGGSRTFVATAGMTSYLWSTGATTSSISVNTTGTYNVTITNASGCSSSCSRELTVNPLPTCGITGLQTVCQGGSRMFSASAGMSSYLWSTGGTSQTINVSTSGTYTVTITNAGGCSSFCSRDFTVNPPPTCGITGDQSACTGGSRTFTASAGMSSYLWSTGATSQSISVNATGTYYVTITNSNGCSNSCSRIFTVNPPPTCSITGEQTVCAGGSRTFTAAAGMASYLWSTGATTQSINVATTGTYYVTITNANGCSSSCNRALTVNPLPTCTLVAPAMLPVSGTSSNTLSVTSNGASRVWSVSSSDNSWMIIGSNTGTSITYKSGTAGTTGTFTVVSTSSEGCTGSCSVTFGNMLGEYCTKTQGYYGNQGGKTCDNKTTTQAVTQALSAGSIVLGDGTRKLTILASEVSCLITKMPAGTTPAVLPVGNVTCATASSSSYLNNGKFISVLVGQTLAMSLNIRLNAALGNVALTNRYLTTYGATSCTNGNAISGSKQVFAIPQSVLTYLGANNKVSDLMTLANKALGMTYVPSGTQPTLSDITAALDALNKGFDGCRILAGFSANSSGLKLDDEEHATSSTNEGLNLTSYPNPFNSMTTLSFRLDETSNASLDIYSMTGARIATVFNGVANADEEYPIAFDASDLSDGVYVCRLSTAGKSVVTKLVLVK